MMNRTDTFESKTAKSWPKVRKFFNDIHLWLGLISGIIIFMVCLSGTVYVFNTEIRELAAPHLYEVAPVDGGKLNIAELMSAVRKESGSTIISLKIPSDPGRSYTITVKKKEAAEKEGSAKREGEVAKNNQPGQGVAKGTAGGSSAGPPGGRGTPYMINPYTGDILGDTQSSKTAVSEFMGWMFSLHRWLLLDKIEEPLIADLENRKLGSYITGTATMLFTLGVLTGIVIWFPRKVRSWKQGLKVKWNGNWKRINHDLHNSLGLYSCILLLLMGLTGPQWSFPWYREALKKSLGTYQPEATSGHEAFVSGAARPGEKTIKVEDYLAIADRQLTYDGDYTVSLPSDSTGVVVISKNSTGFFAPAAADKLTLDQHTGAILNAEIFRTKPFNERVSGSIKALHIGDVYGTFSKILYFLACLIATSLPITGTLIWMNKLKKK